VDNIEDINKSNLRRLSEMELWAIKKSDNVSEHFKTLVFDELTNRGKTEVKKERFGTSHRKKKHKEV
jgi:hypothetical protein